MAQTAHAETSLDRAQMETREFVQLHDGSFAWLNAATGELTAARRQPEWNKLFVLLEKLGPVEPEFMEGIDDPPMEYEEIF